MLPVGGQPILRHVMDIYARQGVTEFLLAAGFQVDVLVDYASALPAEWRVDVVDTGLEAGTGARITQCLDRLGDVFYATYGDGVGNIDIGCLADTHRRHCGAAVLTAVPLPSQYGTIEIGENDRVTGFTEKPVLSERWINAGFFVFDRATYGAHAADDLEREVLPALAGAGQLVVYRHDGFWKSLDTYKDQVELDQLMADGTPPWAR